MQLVDFHYPLVLLEELYGITMEDESYEELALHCYALIGNQRTRMYRYVGKVDCENKVDLPCNCDEDSIEAVFFPGEDWNITSNKFNLGDWNSQWVEHYTEMFKHNRNPLYGRGHFAKYEYWDNALHFDHAAGMPVLIMYHGELLDDDGYPQLTISEAQAIADYCAYITKFKEGLATNNANIITVSNMIKDSYLKHIDAARVPSHIDQNTMNEILDAKSSWDRHMYGKSTKIQ